LRYIFSFTACEKIAYNYSEKVSELDIAI